MKVNNPFDFSGKTVILTGGAGGLGYPISIAFDKAGAKVAVCDLNEQALAGIANEIGELGGSSFTDRIDLCSQREL
jgi:NAD(P)-dependent dehydrogenase (short-subunit alcohol dehydrogenase family)